VAPHRYPTTGESSCRICGRPIGAFARTGGRTTEHLAPKTRNRALAYEWSNYRLVCGLMNGRKSDFEDVLDPFTISSGWFELALASMRVSPCRGLAPGLVTMIQETIDRLMLNDRDCRDARAELYDEWLAGHIDDDFFARRSPFVYEEVRRAGIRRPDIA
jgi:hypothetical protein